MEHTESQQALFPQQDTEQPAAQIVRDAAIEIEPTPASPAVSTTPTVPSPVLVSAAESEVKAVEEKKSAVSTADILAFREQQQASAGCAACKELLDPQDTSRPFISLSGRLYHQTCLPAVVANDLKSNPRMDVSMSIRLDQLAHLVELCSLSPRLKDVHDHLADVICEHDTWYTRCAYCGKVVRKHDAIIGGEHTRKVKEETKMIVALSSGRFFSRLRSMEVFCSKGCDLNYSKALYKAWEEEKAKKAVAPKPKVKKEEDAETAKKRRISQGLKALALAAKENKDVAAELKALIEMLNE